jgi:hypothetical protein
MELGTIAGLDAQAALAVAYNTAAGKVTDRVLFQDLGGMTLLPGVYKFAAAAALTGVLTLDADGDPNAVWTFQIGSALLFAGGSKVVFSSGTGNANHVCWQVGSSATIMGEVTVIGNILAYASITSTAGSTVNGRLLARVGAVTLIADKITVP